MKQDMILVLDLGSEENPRLAREIRALGVYSEIHPHDITLEELKAQSLILRREDAGTRRLFESSLAGHMENIRNFDVRLEMDNINAIKDLVAANLGVTIIAHSACREETSAGRLVAVSVEGMRMVREINVVYQDDFNHPEVLEEIRRIYQGFRP